MSEERRDPQQLTSWKEIADYLHISVRTAQTWEREKGLQVQRMAGKKGRVSADPAELDRWKQSVSHCNHWFSSPLFLGTYAALATALLIAAAAYESSLHWRQSTQGSPASVQLKGGSAAIPGRLGTGHSRVMLPQTAIQTGSLDTMPALHRKISFVDIDNDGELETILDYSPVQPHPSWGPVNRPAAYGKKSEDISPVPVSSASSQKLPLKGNIESATIFCSVRSFKGRGLLLGRQLPNRYKGLLVATPGAKMKATASHLPHGNGAVTGGVQPHCAHCEQVSTPPSQRRHS